MTADDQKVRARLVLRKVLKDLDAVARMLDPADADVIQRLRSASRDVKRADGRLA